MSGRTPPCSPWPVTWVAKSQCSTMPASCTIRSSCSSPHRPRTCGARSALTSCLVSPRSCSELVAHRADLLAQPGVGGLALLLHGAQLALDPLQRGGHRVQQLGDGVRPGRGVAVGLGVQRGRGLLDPALGERDELLVVAGQRVGGERLEGLLQLGVAAEQQLLALRARPPARWSARPARPPPRTRPGAAARAARSCCSASSSTRSSSPARSARSAAASARAIAEASAAARAASAAVHPGPATRPGPRGAGAERHAHQHADEQHDSAVVSTATRVHRAPTDPGRRAGQPGPAAARISRTVERMVELRGVTVRTAPRAGSGTAVVGCSSVTGCRARLVGEQPALDLEAPAEAAEGAVGAQHPVARHEQRRRVAGAGRGRRAHRGRAAGLRGVLGVGDRAPGRHRAQHLPGVLQERARPLPHRHVVDRGQLAGVVAGDRRRATAPRSPSAERGRAAASGGSAAAARPASAVQPEASTAPSSSTTAVNGPIGVSECGPGAHDVLRIVGVAGGGGPPQVHGGVGPPRPPALRRAGQAVQVGRQPERGGAAAHGQVGGQQLVGVAEHAASPGSRRSTARCRAARAARRAARPGRGRRRAPASRRPARRPARARWRSAAPAR